MNIAHLLASTARSFADLAAISLGARRVHTYGELHRRVAQLAGGLRSMQGVQPGDRVALAMTNCPQYIEVMWACWQAGLCAVPINAKLHPREFAYIFEVTAARVVFVTAELVEALSPLVDEIATLQRVVCVEDAEYDRLCGAEPLAMQPVDEADPAWLFFTSGTTGRPKGAMLSHHALLAMTLRYYADVDQVGTDDHMIHCAPLSHASGLYSLPHMAKGSGHVIPESRGFDPAEVFELVRRYPSATLFLRADHADANDRASWLGRRRAGPVPHHLLRRRADVSRGPEAGACALRSVPLAGLRPRRDAEHDHIPLEGDARRQRPSPF